MWCGGEGVWGNVGGLGWWGNGVGRCGEELLGKAGQVGMAAARLSQEIGTRSLHQASDAG